MSKTVDGQQILELRIKGESVSAIAEQLECSTADVQDTLDWHTRATLHKHLRANTLALELERLDKLQRAYQEKAEAGDTAAAHLCLKAMERRQVLLGIAAPARVDPQLIELQNRPAVNSVERIRQALEHLREPPIIEGEKNE